MAPESLEAAGDEASNRRVNEPCYAREPFQRETDFEAPSVTCKLNDLLVRVEAST